MRKNRIIMLGFGAFAAVYLGLFFWQTERLRAPGSATPSIDSFTLDNGLRVIGVRIPDADKTTLMVWYGVGGADDPADSPGLAHYLEHVSFSVLKQHEEPGGSGGPIAEAFTSYDFTAYYYALGGEEVGPALQMEARRMAELRFDDAAIGAERDAVVDERHERIDDDSHAALEEQLQAVAFAGSPYGRPIVPPESEVTAEALLAFWQTWYVPNNAVLVVAGPLDLSSVRPLIERSFAQLPARPIPPRTRPESTPLSDRLVVIEEDGNEKRLWARMYRVSRLDARQHIASLMVARILADGPNARLHRALIGSSLASEVTAEYAPEGLGGSPFTLHAYLTEAAKLPDVEKAVNEEITKLMQGGPLPEEMSRARKAINETMQQSWSDPFEAASMVGSTLITGRTLNDVMEASHLIATITPADVRLAAIKLFSARAAVTGIVGPPSL